MSDRRYAIVIEGGEPGSNYSAYVPDLPGCVTVGDTLEEVRRNMREAIALHLHGLYADGEALPAPSVHTEYIVVEDDPEAWARGVQDIARSAPLAGRR